MSITMTETFGHTVNAFTLFYYLPVVLKFKYNWII